MENSFSGGLLGGLLMLLGLIGTVLELIVLVGALVAAWWLSCQACRLSKKAVVWMSPEFVYLFGFLKECALAARDCINTTIEDFDAFLSASWPALAWLAFLVTPIPILYWCGEKSFSWIAGMATFGACLSIIPACFLFLKKNTLHYQNPVAFVVVLLGGPMATCNVCALLVLWANE